MSNDQPETLRQRVSEPADVEHAAACSSKALDVDKEDSEEQEYAR